MDFQILFEQFINGITQGSIYALLALGFTMIFGTLRMVTFAHGEVYMLGAYVGFEIIRLLHPSFFLALAVALAATAQDYEAAYARGVHTTRYKIQAFVLAAFYAGIAGSYYAHFVKYISPDSFYIYESFILLAMLAFGGQGNLIGPVVGAAVLIIIPEVFRFLQEYRMLVYGSVLIIMMLVRRQGLLGGRHYSLRLTRFDDQQQAVYTRGDKFLPTE